MSHMSHMLHMSHTSRFSRIGACAARASWRPARHRLPRAVPSRWGAQADCGTTATDRTPDAPCNHQRGMRAHGPIYRWSAGAGRTVSYPRGRTGSRQRILYGTSHICFSSGPEPAVGSCCVLPGCLCLLSPCAAPRPAGCPTSRAPSPCPVSRAPCPRTLLAGPGALRPLPMPSGAKLMAMGPEPGPGQGSCRRPQGPVPQQTRGRCHGGRAIDGQPHHGPARSTQT